MQSVNVILNKNAKLTRGTEEAAGYDLCYNGPREMVTIQPYQRVALETGVRLEIATGYYAKNCGRSGLAFKQGLFCVEGTIDSDYRGEVKTLLFNSTHKPITILKGDRISQLIFMRHETPEIKLVTQFDSETQRGENGFGHTGN